MTDPAFPSEPPASLDHLSLDHSTPEPASAPPVPWSPNLGKSASPTGSGSGAVAGAKQQTSNAMGSPPAEPATSKPTIPDAALTPTERRQLIDTFRRRDAWRGFARRVAAAAVLTASLAAGLVWAIAQPWWSAALLARLPQPAVIVQWLRSPDLNALPGLPPAWNPWAPLALDDANTFLTRWKINRLESDSAACQSWLSALPAADLTPLPDFADSGTLLCGWKSASRIRQLDGVRFSSPFTLACGAAVALARWEHHALQPAALEHLGSKVVRIEHLGSYACRTIGSGAEGSLSTHANANALDIAGFTLANGRHISVRQDWRSTSDDSSGLMQSIRAEGDVPRRRNANPNHAERVEEARFLRTARDGACHSFNAVLGPDYNAAHSDHFHLDRGPYRVCR